jgi:hypothetical protein
MVIGIQVLKMIAVRFVIELESEMMFRQELVDVLRLMVMDVVLTAVFLLVYRQRSKRLLGKTDVNQNGQFVSREMVHGQFRITNLEKRVMGKRINAIILIASAL